MGTPIPCPSKLGAWRSLASAPEWGSGGRWFESSRPDIASLAVTTSCSEAFFMQKSACPAEGRESAQPHSGTLVAYNGVARGCCLCREPQVNLLAHPL